MKTSEKENPQWLTIEFIFDVKECQEILLSSHASRSCTEKHFQSCLPLQKSKDGLGKDHNSQNISTVLLIYRII